MKVRSILLPVVTAAFCGYGVQQEGQEAALEAKVEALEARVVAVETYLQAQAKSAKAFEAAIDSAVDKGYLAGINSEAREALVSAWRASTKAAGQNVPGKAAPAEKKAVDPRILRRTGGK